MIEKIQQFISLPPGKDSARKPEIWCDPDNALRFVYTEKNYRSRYIADLASAKSLILIVSPYGTDRAVRELSDVLSAAMRRGVRVCTFMQEPKDWHERSHEHVTRGARYEIDRLETSSTLLKNIGAHVTLRPKDHVKITIIDGHILWEGSLNFLSHYDTRERESHDGTGP